MKRSWMILATLATLPLLTATARAAVYVDFSGGGGAPLSFNLGAIAWDITDATAFNAGDVFGIGIAVGQTPAISLYDDSSSGGNPADWSASGATEFPTPILENFYGNNNFGGANNGGILWYGMKSNQAAVNGETVTFSGGMLGNNVNVTQSFADGFYEVYLVDAYNAQPVSTAAIAVPEPSALAMVLGAGILALRRRRHVFPGSIMTRKTR